MNKSFNYILAFFIVICSSLTLYAQEEKYQIGLIKKIYFMGTASVNGTYYPLGNAISRLLGKKLKNMVVIAEPTPGSIANVEYLRKKRIDLALMQSDVAWKAYKGNFKDLRVLASLYSEKIQIVVRADSKLNKLEDLKGKKIAVGEKESGSAAGAAEILDTAGLKNGTDYEIVYERFTKSTDSLCDGYVDAIYYVGAVPADGLIRLSNRVPIRLIEISPEIIHNLTSKYPYYSAEKIGAEAYKGQTKEVNTLGFKALLTCTSNFSADEAFAMLDVIYSNPRILSDQNEVLLEVNPRDALIGVDAMMLHEGAARYLANLGTSK